MEPDLEVVQVRDDQSFKIWSHGYPFRTVRWHFHPEYELHLVTVTEGNRFVGDHIGRFGPGDLVLLGPNLPHNWISDVPNGTQIGERCIVLQFTEQFIAACLSAIPELRFFRSLLEESTRGVRFAAETVEQVTPLLRELLNARESRRVALFIEVLDRLGDAPGRVPLASIGFRPNPSAYLSTAMNLVLRHIESNFTSELSEADMAKLIPQSASGFSRSFRKHTGMSFVHYVNALRIDLACQHLSQDELSITDICYEVGFNNVSNFNRQFLAVKGMPPSKFRLLRRERSRVPAPA